MNNSLALPLSHAQRALASATTPAKSKHAEVVSKTAMAYYDEQANYEGYMQAWRVYLLARRKTTELVQAQLAANTRVTDIPAFTPMQWSRRLKELAIEQERIDKYFDELVQNGWQPSINGMLRHANGSEIDHYEQAVALLLRGANKLLSEYPHRLTPKQKAAVKAVQEAFA